jgi:azurin/glucose/arabinose dehydrogenase
MIINIIHRPAKYLLTVILCALFSSFLEAQTTKIQKEDDFSKIHTVVIPQTISLEVGGMVFMPNDELAVSTRHGEVWIISNPYMKNGLMPTYRLFAQGLHEALGLNYINGSLYLTQRGELTRLRDTDGDGVADEYETICSWPLAGNYHEFAYGPVLDRDGNMIVTRNVSWTSKMGESLARWQGWMLKITPDGKIHPFATGMRSPAAFALNDKGDIFYAENQGDWVGSGSITDVEEGDFMGHPQGLKWAGLPGSPVKLRMQDIPNTGEPKFEVAKRVPGLKTPSVWLPHTILGVSTSAILSYEGKGKMGPFEGQLFVGDQGQSKIMRVYLEKVKGVYQGAAFNFREGFSSGIIRTVWGSDGSMFVGMTSRGWPSTGTALYGLQRLEWLGKTPFEIKTIQARPDGFELEFTLPVDEKTARDVTSYNLTNFTYMYHNAYGSPIINLGGCPIRAIIVSPDRLHVRLVVDSLKLGYIHQVTAAGVRSADSSFALLHNYGYYTLNRIPDGDKVIITAENRVEPVHMQMDMHETKMKVMPVIANTAKHVTKQPASWVNGPDDNITITSKPGLKFSTDIITVKADAKVKLTFNNTDDMLHNMAILAPGGADAVGQMSLKLGLVGERMSYIPNTPLVMFHTLLLQPGKSETIYFTAPKTPGEYPYICTYPGHYMVMKGILKVVAP